MSIVQNPVIGQARKQAGGMVFRTLFDKNIMQSKPFVYTDKKSQEQLNNRLLFTVGFNINKSIRDFYTLLGIYRMSNSSSRSIFHSVFSYVRKALYLNADNVCMDITELDLGPDEIDKVTIDSYEVINTWIYKFTWNASQYRVRGLNTDKINVIIFNFTSKSFIAYNSEVAIADGEISVDMSNYLYPTGKFYIGFQAFDDVNNKLSLVSGLMDGFYEITG